MKSWVTAIALFLSPLQAFATVVLPYTYSSGNTIKASEANANEGALRDEINTHETATNPHSTTLEQILNTSNTTGAATINFNLSQGQSFRAENVSADPVCNAGALGRLIWNTTSSLYKICNGTSYVSIAGTGVNNLASVLTAGNSAGSTNLDMNEQQIIKHRLENLTSDPSPGNIGRIWFNTSSSIFKIDNGTSVGALGGAQNLASVLNTGNVANMVIDFNGNVAKNVVLENLASDPGTTVEGRIYENTGTHVPKMYNGTSWINVGNTNTLAQTLALGSSAGSTDLNMNQRQVKSLRLDNQAGAPGTGPAGLIWYDTVTNQIGYATGSASKLACSLDDAQTLTNKTISGSSNTITNIGDSSLSSNVLLKTGSQTITGTKTFSPTGFPITSYVGTPSGAQHQLTDGLSNDTFTLNNASQELKGKTLNAPSLSGNLDFNEYQANHMRLENLSVQPPAGNTGRIFYDTATGEVRFDTGSSWNVLTANASLSTAIGQLTGDVTALGPGVATATVVLVGGSSAANVHSAELLANAATNANTASTIVKRDASGNFSAGTVTATVTGHSSLDLPLTGGTMSGTLQMGGFSVANLATPVNTTDATTKAYVDSLINGLDYKEACKYATTAALATNVYSNGASGVGATLTGFSFGALLIDGNTPSIGDRILVKNEVTQANNGIYTVTAVGSGAAFYVLTRSADFNQSSELEAGDSTFISSGTALVNTTWTLTTATGPTMGTTAITFSQTGGANSIVAGNGISVNSFTVALNNPVTSANGGLGTSASAATGIGHWAAGTFTASAVKLNNQIDTSGLLPSAQGGLSVNASASTGIGHWAAGAWSASAINLANQLDSTGILPAAQGGLSVSMASSTGVLFENNGTAYTDKIDLANSVVVRGNLSTGNLNSGLLAGATNFWRGDGTWAVPTASSSGLSVTTVTAPYTVSSSSDVVLVTGKGTSFSVTLYTAVGNSGKMIRFKRTDDYPTNHVTLTGNASETIDGNRTRTLATQAEGFDLVSDGSNWQVVQHYIDTKEKKYTPAIVGYGTVVNPSFTYAREGNRLHVRGYWKAGTVNASAPSIQLPNGISLAGIVPGLGNQRNMVGTWAAATVSATPSNLASNNNFNPIWADPVAVDSSTVQLTERGDTSQFTLSAGNVISAASQGIMVDFTVVAAGWE